MKKKELYLATSNPSKLKEFQNLLGENYILKTLLDTEAFLAKLTTIVETGASFGENALIKARTFSEIIQKPALADDSGLEILALDNFPGIYSARWIKKSGGIDAANNNILNKMSNVKDRRCQYVTALAYVDVTKNIEKVFVATLVGEIHSKIASLNGFGFDSIFYLPKYNKILSELSITQKNKISQRAKAMHQLFAWMNK